MKRDSDAIRQEGEALLALLLRVEPLKHLPRTGWVDREILAPESVAAHSWRLALMVWLIADQMGLDSAHAVRIALVHDLAESITGDHTPFDGMAATPGERRALAINPPDRNLWHGGEKHQAKLEAERAAMRHLTADLGPAFGDTLLALWEEYAAASSPEADLVHQLDKLEAVIQGWEYAADHRLADQATLNSFDVGLDSLIRADEPRALLAAMQRWRAAIPPDAT